MRRHLYPSQCMLRTDSTSYEIDQFRRRVIIRWRSALPSSVREARTWKTSRQSTGWKLRKLQYSRWSLGCRVGPCWLFGISHERRKYHRPYLRDAYTGRFSKHKTWYDVPWAVTRRWWSNQEVRNILLNCPRYQDWDNCSYACALFSWKDMGHVLPMRLWTWRVLK